MRCGAANRCSGSSASRSMTFASTAASISSRTRPMRRSRRWRNPRGTEDASGLKPAGLVVGEELRAHDHLGHAVPEFLVVVLVQQRVEVLAAVGEAGTRGSG